MPAVSGIYKILCVPTGKFYIGSSNNVKRRWGEHRKRLRQGSHPSAHLQNAWNLHGEASFEFVVLELTPVEILLSREQVWLDSTKSYERKIGYNSALRAEAPFQGKKYSVETRAKISAAVKAQWSFPATRVRQCAAMKKALSDPAVRARKSSSAKARCSTPEARAAQSARSKKYWAIPGAREKHSEVCKGRKFSAEHIANLSAAHTGVKLSATHRNSLSTAMFARWDMKRQQEVHCG